VAPPQAVALSGLSRSICWLRKRAEQVPQPYQAYVSKGQSDMDSPLSVSEESPGEANPRPRMLMDSVMVRRLRRRVLRTGTLRYAQGDGFGFGMEILNEQHIHTDRNCPVSGLFYVGWYRTSREMGEPAGPGETARFEKFLTNFPSIMRWAWIPEGHVNAVCLCRTCSIFVASRD